jgi:hypothetical protein
MIVLARRLLTRAFPGISMREVSISSQPRSVAYETWPDSQRCLFGTRDKAWRRLVTRSCYREMFIEAGSTRCVGL